MYLVGLSWQRPHFWTVHIVIHPLPRPYLQTRTCLETIFTSSILV